MPSRCIPNFDEKKMNKNSPETALRHKDCVKCQCTGILQIWQGFFIWLQNLPTKILKKPKKFWQ